MTEEIRMCDSSLSIKGQGKLIIFLALVFIFLNILDYVYAFRAIQLDQDRVRIITKAGTTYTGKIEVKNPSEEPKEVKAYLQDWVFIDDQGAKKILPPGSVINSCANWIKIVPQEFTVPAFGKRTINYSVDIPEGASGGYYAILFCESFLGEPEVLQQQQQTAVAIVPIAVRVGFLFTVEIAGTSERKVEITDLSINRRDNNYLMDLVYSNTGNVDIKANGNFSVMDKHGMVYARGQFDDTYTLPKDKAKFSGKWKDILPKGTYDLILTIDLGRALQDYNLGRGPIVVKEAEIEVDKGGQILKIGAIE